MNPGLAVLMFLVLFAILMMAVGLGSRFLELRSKKNVVSMIGGEAQQDADAAADTSILVAPEDRAAFDALMERSPLQEWMQNMIQQAGLQWAPSHLLVAMVLGGLAGAFLGFLLRPLGFMWLSMLAFAAILGSVPLAYVRYKRGKRLGELEEQLPEALDFLARSMRAGHAFSISLEMLGAELPDPLGQEFRALFNEHNLGAPIEVALRNFGKRVPLLDVRLFISSVQLQRQTGGNLSEILTRLAFLIRERFRLRGQIRAASAHGRLTSLVLTILPIVMVFALQVVAPGYLPQMARDPDGKWMIVAAVVFQFAGYWVMRRITNIKV
jgi:tight adherence protein B